jgi:hypothetical protein
MSFSAVAQTPDNQPASAAGSSAAQAASNTTAPSGATFLVTLSKSIDAKKTKNGDEITAKTAQELRSASGQVIPKGSKVIGHVTEAKARAKGDSESSLGIAFDRVSLKGGQEIPIHTNIQALAAPANNAPAQMGDDNIAAAGSPGGAGPAPMSGQAGPMGAPNRSVANAPTGVNPPTSGVNPTGAAGNRGSAELSPTSTGVIGLNGIELSAGANGQGSLIISSGKDVKLDSGTRMVLQVLQ